ncbi:uncharacterized protein [Miscanthus floridulus]|uniref:uncharacterized protein n=1 Tax=Miscanthus floridulus TaxID=154761 RepID=UPI0034586E17
MAKPDAPSAAETPSTEPEVMEVNAELPQDDQDADWRALFLDWLDRGELPDDRTEAQRLARRAKTYVLYNGELYRQSPSGVLQRCISSEAGQALLWDLHTGACGHHAAPRTLIGNAFRQGFYWLTAVTDATKLVRSYEGCQYYARQTHLPALALQTIPITWPFTVWGLDMVGPLAKGPQGATPIYWYQSTSSPNGSKPV